MYGVKYFLQIFSRWGAAAACEAAPRRYKELSVPRFQTTETNPYLQKGKQDEPHATRFPDASRSDRRIQRRLRPHAVPRPSGHPRGGGRNRPAAACRRPRRSGCDSRRRHCRLGLGLRTRKSGVVVHDSRSAPAPRWPQLEHPQRHPSRLHRWHATDLRIRRRPILQRRTRPLAFNAPHHARLLPRARSRA